MPDSDEEIELGGYATDRSAASDLGGSSPGGGGSLGGSAAALDAAAAADAADVAADAEADAALAPAPAPHAQSSRKSALTFALAAAPAGLSPRVPGPAAPPGMMALEDELLVREAVGSELPTSSGAESDAAPLWGALAGDAPPDGGDDSAGGLATAASLASAGSGPTGQLLVPVAAAPAAQLALEVQPALLIGAVEHYA